MNLLKPPEQVLWCILISSDVNPSHKVGSKNNPKLVCFNTLLNSASLISCIPGPDNPLISVQTLGYDAAATPGCKSYLLYRSSAQEKPRLRAVSLPSHQPSWEVTYNRSLY